MKERNCLILTQYRDDSQYNDFIGKFYHFPATEKKNYLKQFENLPIEIIYYEPDKRGAGEFYGYGKIIKQPFQDKREPDHYFVEITDFRPFAQPVNFKNEKGEILEKLYNSDYYNYNNAVRRIKPKFLDELCLDGGIVLNFKADAHLVQVLGEQLIASERVGILELVKNAFDAGASYCNVIIEKVPGLTKITESLYQYNEYEGPVIVIEDDGSGMTKEQIELGWLRPASTLKTNVKQRLKAEKEIAIKKGQLKTFESFVKLLKVEHKGRIPLGEKGVGRFATHRLGSKLILKSKIAENDYEFVLKINWDDFISQNNAPMDLDSVGLSLTRQPASRDYGVKNSGTQLIIYGGREGLELTEAEINEINNTILKLNSPNPPPTIKVQEFKVNFNCIQVKNLSTKSSFSRDNQVFRIYGIVDEKGIFEYDYFFTPPYSDKIPLNGFEKRNETVDIKKHNKKYFLKEIDGRRLWKIPTCGSFYIHIDIWYRDNPWVEKTDRPFLDYLKEYGGLSIYRDGINVYPAEWGAKYDWLGLRQRQISQAKRISYYHMIGNIEIEQSNNIELIDKTNREGMIQNTAFHDLAELTKAVVQYVELDYMGKREELTKLTGGLIREPRTLNEFSKQSSKIIANIHDKYDVVSDPYLLLSELGDISERKKKLVDLAKSSKNLQKNLELMTEVQDLLTEQAGFGLGIAVALHEINKVASNFYYGIMEVIKKKQFDKVKLEDLKNTSAALESELMRISPLRALRNEKDTLFRVSESIEYVKSIFQWQFDKIGINISYNSEEDFQVIARFGAVNQILTNLFDNSCYWLDDPDLLKQEIKLELDSKNRTIIVADSGPGIAESILPYLFQPGYSLKEPQSGLGLYVCKHYMNLMKKRGDIYLVKERDRIENLSGAQFLLDFSNVKSEYEE
ncbi:sensor histidine kinase [Aequorivita todarodis]|uniref:sensor histidine kinase n=1 Tax=Aequorivita todarodis TaxID=2036821 RepID=UPI002350C636|nr:sensor histidine kinase [Aequorivita todarodis]MDC8001137.1 sensor histidine kinase [Aequorivita todarodis]